MPSQKLALHESSTTSAILINTIPEAERSGFLIRLIESLKGDDVASLQFISGVVANEANQDVKNELLSKLEIILLDGNLDPVVAISSQYPDLGAELLERAVSTICEARSNSTIDLFEKDSIQLYLKFSRFVISHLPYSNAHARLLEVCLELSTSASDGVSKIATDIVYSIFAGNEELQLKESIHRCQDEVWTAIRKLATSTGKQQGVQGYSLWLRYILCTPADHWTGLMDTTYWELLLHGLRHRDSERRKVCLNIIKLSVASDTNIISGNLQHQYDRYCTVFETIVLGRYINQVQECENDLNALVNSQELNRKWLYVLLASGIDPGMQESNRRFIGNWVMKSSLKYSDEMKEFFQHDFLPWAIQGQLFVSTLKRVKTVLRCTHGDSLAAFIRKLNQDSGGSIIDILIHAIRERGNHIFAYAVVYILEGVSEYVRCEHMSDLARIKALPEVARSYVKLVESNIGYEATGATTQSRREITEKAAIEKSLALEANEASIQNLWADLEYLEFRKRLLMAVPIALFEPSIVQSATRDQTLANSLNEKMHVLQKVSSTKIYGYPPLMHSIRKAILIEPATSTVLPIAAFIIRTCEQPPEATVDLMLEEAAVHLTPYNYEDYFGERSSYGFAALLDLVSRMKGHQDVVQTILNHILSRWKAQKLPPPTISAWKNILQLQVLLICCEQYEVDEESKVRELLDDLFHVLAVEPLSRYRYLLEATIVRHIIRYELQETVIDRLNTKDHHSNPKHLVSLMKIATILACRGDSNESFSERLAATFVPLAASSKVVIRHEAQWRVPILMDYCHAKGWTSVTENPAYASLDSYIRSFERFSDPPLERKIGNFNPDADLTLSNIAEGQWFELDELEPPLTSHDDFVKLYANDSISDLPESCIPLGNKIIRDANIQRCPNAEKTDTKPALGPRTSTEATALQTKGTAYLARTLADPASHTSRPHDLIVVGSLVDNPYNLGGLSRVSEIFGAAALTLQNQNVVSNKDFASVSVSSHLHFPLVQLSASGIPAFLAERKLEGYTVVGIEQTDRSVILGSDSCQLPKKCVLVVGSEKEGIPAVILTESDILVEIPQAGVTRSLNVQTAVGIVLFEYSRQHQR